MNASLFVVVHIVFIRINALDWVTQCDLVASEAAIEADETEASEIHFAEQELADN